MRSPKHLKAAGYRMIVKIVKIKEKEKLSKGGLVLDVDADSAIKQFATQEAEVVSLGPIAFKGFADGSPWCKVGDIIRVPKYSGESLVDEETGDIYRICNDDDCIAIVESNH